MVLTTSFWVDFDKFMLDKIIQRFCLSMISSCLLALEGVDAWTSRLK